MSRSSDVRLSGFGLLCGQPMLRQLPGAQAAQMRNREVYVHTRHVLFHGVPDRSGAYRLNGRNRIPRGRSHRARHGHGGHEGSPTIAVAASRVRAVTGVGPPQ